MVTTIEEAGLATVSAAWPLNAGVLPCVDGVPVSDDLALALHNFVTGDTMRAAAYFDDLAERSPDDRRDGILAQRDAEAIARLNTTKALFAVFVKLTGGARLSLELADGSVCDPDTLNLTQVGETLRGVNPRGWSGKVPSLKG